MRAVGCLPVSFSQLARHFYRIVSWSKSIPVIICQRTLLFVLYFASVVYQKPVVEKCFEGSKVVRTCFVNKLHYYIVNLLITSYFHSPT